MLKHNVITIQTVVLFSNAIPNLTQVPVPFLYPFTDATAVLRIRIRDEFFSGPRISDPGSKGYVFGEKRGER
jgi:hypothetical protein